MINNLKLYHLMCVQSCGLQIDKQMAITNVNSNFYTYFFFIAMAQAEIWRYLYYLPSNGWECVKKSNAESSGWF